MPDLDVGRKRKAGHIEGDVSRHRPLTTSYAVTRNIAILGFVGVVQDLTWTPYIIPHSMIVPGAS